MQEVSFEQALEQIRIKDPRYARDAYLFVREALDHTQKNIVKATRESKNQRDVKAADGAPPPIRHVTGQELLEGIRAYALTQYGPMVITVFEEWGINQCADFGEIVFNMVEIGLLAKTEKDTREDFKDGYSFDEAFRKPFLPGRTLSAKDKPVAS
jgi:uncharacterized repeat protein (TIGR04138 family)